jgi:DNA-binding NarL/FixJ family response regulator
MMMPRVLIVEDHPLVSDATRDLLLCDGRARDVAIAATAADALAQVSRDVEAWDLILLDLDVPGARGLSLAHELAQRGLAGRTCIVTALSRPGYVEEAKRLGFLGFIAKSSPLQAFGDELRRVLQGIRTFPDSDRLRPRSTPRLTRQQQRVLDLMGQGLSSKQMARALEISEGTVNNHVNAMLRALGASSRLQAFSKAVQLGLIDALPLPDQPGPLARAGQCEGPL